MPPPKKKKKKSGPLFCALVFLGLGHDCTSTSLLFFSELGKFRARGKLDDSHFFPSRLLSFAREDAVLFI